MSTVDRNSSEFREALELYQRAPLLELGALADATRHRLHPEPTVSYIIDRNINYTNVCVADCAFCAFYRRPKDNEGYVLSFEEIGAKIDECKAIGGAQILLQGGHNPYIPFDWYLELMRYIKAHHPIHIHGFSPSEVVFFSERFRIPMPEVVRQLHEAGLDSIPGGGGEILVDEVRERVAKKKAQTDEWLGVQEEAHRQGMKTSVTMMYGLGESDEDRIEHLFRIREVQARTGGFTAFICWPLQPEGTAMSDRVKTDAVTYLRTLATARILVDNIPNMQASWVTMGLKVGQVALRFGANDFGSLMMEENVVSAAGTTYRATIEEMERAIRDAGMHPARRRQDYSLIESPLAAVA
ncbi:MAG: dehypoxanthine futalosine cyclase [Gemmatimonadales bacterium]|nr:dehypoxanthine futalosine cyclase [Gemmatimonadales bacterium]MBP7620700.1 dehypoxanthine futalosine cyclase [Gemmatimonadales bacterium]